MVRFVPCLLLVLACGEHHLLPVDGDVPDAGPPGECGMPTDLGRAVGIGVARGSTRRSRSRHSPSCGSGGIAPDVAYTWTAPSEGSFTFSTAGSTFDTLLELRTGSCTGPSLGCDDDTGGGLQSEVVVTLRRGMEVFVIVDGFGSSEGDFVLNILRSGDVRPEDCRNGIDDDADGSVDCEDRDCRDGLDCRPMFEDCFDGRDNDRDGLVDCDDGDCRGECDVSEDCFDGRDDDGDGLTDCEDPDCRMFCVDELCGNGIDDDRNGLTDCEDPFCAEFCAEREDCGNGVDDDGDGLVDCEDVDCGGDPRCRTPGECPDAVLSGFGRLVVGEIGPDVVSEREDATCGSRGRGAEVEFLWTAPMAGSYRILTEAPPGGRSFDTVLSIRADECFGPELACDDDGGEGTFSEVLVTLLEAQSIVIVLEAYGVGASGRFALRIDPIPPV